MKYYLIAGEASGDLHASNLMKALQQRDAEAQFRFFGGDAMAAVGGTMVMHYSQLAYMGFVQVALHARPILEGMRLCKRDITSWSPDVVILVDYPGFNLKIARFVKSHTSIPVWYYIPPKIWAWKQRRIRNIRRDVDEVFSILPFEVPFYTTHHYTIHYVGNPCADAIADYRRQAVSREVFISRNSLSDKPLVALLAGSRKAEIRDNLPRMLEAIREFPDVQPVVAGAPGIMPEFYTSLLRNYNDTHPQVPVAVVFGQTYPLLDHAHAALVTSGTATLETALMRVPQVVCYYTKMGKLVSFARRLILKVPYISLVNLIAGKEVVPELVADGMNVANIRHHLRPLLDDTPARQAMLNGYDALIASVGEAGVSARAAQQMLELKKKREQYTF
ncbi:MAG: lipid-A-disaccharide synthase [Bacteroidaceae bacterium]|nr:lipid-A-disaccharide synthase [Bacteroidaceae bacterium]